MNGYYVVDLNSLKASLIQSKDQVFNTSDLANGNLALQREADQKAGAAGAASVDRRELIRNNHIAIYPNPVTEGTVRVYFNNQQQGQYRMQLLDVAGRVVNEERINIATKIQVEEMNVDEKLAKGMYMLKVLDSRKKALFADKILVQ